MEQIVVKTEMQPNGEILLFYVDENADGNGENQVLQLQEASEYEILEASHLENEEQEEEQQEELQEEHQEHMYVYETSSNENWTEDEYSRLLVFYIDNKDQFVKGTTDKSHLWSVACKTMLTNRTPECCETKLLALRKKYSDLRLQQLKGGKVSWDFYDLCHQAFHNDSHVRSILSDHRPKMAKIPVTTNVNQSNGVFTIKNVNQVKTDKDDKVEMMLNLYIQYNKNPISRKSMWETIAMELGVEDADYWHKKFFNLKQQYLRVLTKRESNSSAQISWPYMSLFDKIFENDADFQKKYVKEDNSMKVEVEIPVETEWNETECTVLAKYYFDCYDEFQDSTIPVNFLWNEVGRLLDKDPDVCRQKYEDMRNAHLDSYINGGYDLRSRKPVAIIFDNIISKDVEMELSKHAGKESGRRTTEEWTTEELDELVQFLYENVEMLKDSVCYFVCWASLSKKFEKSIVSCKKQWDGLKELYKSILDDKMENPDLQIEWRYIDLFDRICDYGTDTEFLFNFDNIKAKRNSDKTSKKSSLKIKTEVIENGTDDEEFDEKGYSKRSKRGVGESKAFKILEFYQKHKEKFATTQHKKQSLWEVLAKQIGISGEQCAHRLRNLKQVYTSYVQREISKPETPIMWPYYSLCKKVFGYRAIKNKLKNNSKLDSEETKEWTAKEIKQLIDHFGRHFDELSETDDSSKWQPLAQELGKSESSVYEKFIELRKSYRRLKTMIEQNPDCKVSWKYFSMFDEIYTNSGIVMETEEMEVEEQTVYEEVMEEKTESQDEEDYQCIIVIPEGQDLSDLSNAQIIIKDSTENPDDVIQQVMQNIDEGAKKTTVTKWNKRSKKQLLILYLNYLRSKKGKEIKPLEMWTEIASKMPEKTPQSCRKMFAKLKANHKKIKSENDPDKEKTPYYKLVEKILAIKPKFAKAVQKDLKEGKSFKDVALPDDKVALALQYYLEHIEEFVSPKFDKKYLWTEFAKSVSEPVNKLYNKINYLKQSYDLETDSVAGEPTPFSELLKEIVIKDNLVTSTMDTEPLSLGDDVEQTWSDEEIESLLVWYLANLEKFKNPKYVRKYLWIEASSILGKSPLACSKKMTEIRTQYKTMIKENPEELNNWRFYELCQKIYGTGKKTEAASSLINLAQSSEEQAL